MKCLKYIERKKTLKEIKTSIKQIQFDLYLVSVRERERMGSEN